MCSLPVAAYADGSKLAFGGDDIALWSDEWFTHSAVTDLFIAFLHGRPWPAGLHWRDLPLP